VNSALRQVWVIVWKDIVIDLRRKENLLALFFFSLLTLLIFNFALGQGNGATYRISPRTLQLLSLQGLDAATVRELRPLLGRSHRTPQAFLEALAALPGAGPSTEARAAILAAARRSVGQEIAAGLLWVTFLLAGMLSLGKSFTQERENGCMDGLLMTPAGRGWIYLGKMGSNAVFLVMVLVLLVPLYALLFQVHLQGVMVALAALMLAGVVGFSALGTLLGGITSSLRGRDVLLPLLLFPLLVPMLIVLVHLSNVVLEGQPLGENWRWIQLLSAFDVVFLIASFLVFEYVMES